MAAGASMTVGNDKRGFRIYFDCLSPRLQTLAACLPEVLRRGGEAAAHSEAKRTRNVRLLSHSAWKRIDGACVFSQSAHVCDERFLKFRITESQTRYSCFFPTSTVGKDIFPD